MTAILCFAKKLPGDDRSVRWGIVMVNQPGLFSPKFGATSSHVFTQSPQNVAVEPGNHSLALTAVLTTEYSETTAHFNGNFDTDNQFYVP
jgi:hypothetical protein